MNVAVADGHRREKGDEKLSLQYSTKTLRDQHSTPLSPQDRRCNLFNWNLVQLVALLEADIEDGRQKSSSVDCDTIWTEGMLRFVNQNWPCEFFLALERLLNYFASSSTSGTDFGDFYDPAWIYYTWENWCTQGVCINATKKSPLVLFKAYGIWMTKHVWCDKRDWGRYFDEEEELLLMAHAEIGGTEGESIWFLDSGCSNHMTGDKSWFVELDENFRHFVRLGNNSRMEVQGKGSVRFEVEGIIQTISNVYYVPNLNNNLLSIGQLQEKQLVFIIKEGACRIYHRQRGLIVDTPMTANRMFPVAV